MRITLDTSLEDLAEWPVGRGTLEEAIYDNLGAIGNDLIDSKTLGDDWGEALDKVLRQHGVHDATVGQLRDQLRGDWIDRQSAVASTLRFRIARDAAKPTGSSAFLHCWEAEMSHDDDSDEATANVINSGTCQLDASDAEAWLAGADSLLAEMGFDRVDDWGTDGVWSSCTVVPV